MIILGLTGSIAMGKSTVASLFEKQGIPVFDSDVVANNIIMNNKTVYKAIKKEFPDCIENGKINRQYISYYVFNDTIKLKKLSHIIHPFVRKSREIWASKQKKLNKSIIVFDTPLLYETGVDKKCDKVAVVYAPFWVQKRRVLKRNNMTKEIFDVILKEQINNKEKCRLADFTIPTHCGIFISKWYVKRIINILELLHDRQSEQ